MYPSQHEIVILKPTADFLSFLASKLPATKLPVLRSIQIDNTAYVLEKLNANESTLDVIEKHFATMLRHEVYRWLGDKAPNEIESSFLDFLCCFKFEIQNHIVLMETTMENSHQLLLVKPRLALLNWIKETAEGQDDLLAVVEKVELAHLEENTTAVVKNFCNLTDIKPFVKRYYNALFPTVMGRILNQPEQWPSIDSIQAFNQYFAIEIHTQLVYIPHLAK